MRTDQDPNAAAPRSSIRTLRDVESFESVPLSQRALPATTYDMLRAGAARAPEASALQFFLRAEDFRQPFAWCHAELLAEVTRTANAFGRLGICRRDVVAILLPNLPELHFAIWGGEAAGIAFVINPLLEPPLIAELLRAGRARWLVALGPAPGSDIWQKAVKAAAEAEGLKGILQVSIGRYVRGVPGLALRLAATLRRPAREGSTLPVLQLRREMAKERGDRLNFDLPGAGEVSSYICTGGTTGRPKIAMRTHGSEVFDTWATMNFLPEAFEAGKPVLCGLPLFHVNAQLVTGLGPWSVGGTVVLATPQGYRAPGLIPHFWEIVEHFHIKAFSGVPTVYSALLQVPVGANDISSLQFGFCGAAPMPTELFRTFEKTIDVRIVEAYGLTEGACASSVNPATAPRIGSIGLRLPYQKMRSVILDDDGRFQRFAEPEEVGVLAISGPNVFAGYVDSRQDAGVWIQIEGERWLNTGDLARQDADGYFWMTGRKKELIIRGGHNIDPRVIEEGLQSHPAVQLCAAIGKPDAHAGEVPVAYVQLALGAVASEDELLCYATDRIPERAAHPKAVRILDALPVTPVGKLFKPALVMREIEEVVRGEAAKLGVAIGALEVSQDPSRGLVVRLTAGEGHERLAEALGRYTFQVDLLQAAGQGQAAATS